MNFDNSANRKYAASGVFVFLVLALMLFLTYVTIPPANKDIIISIISVIVGGTGVAMATLFSESESEVDKLRAELTAVKFELAQQEARFDTLKSMYDEVMLQLVKRTDLQVGP